MNFSDMEGARIVSLAELLQLCGAFTGSSSIARCRNDLARGSSTVDLASLAFRAFNFPVILVGTLDLSEEHGSSRRRISGDRGFCFSDRTASVCCAVLAMEMSAIGRKICVLAWNFVPFSQDNAILEIIRWRVHDLEFISSSPSLFPRMEHSKSVRSRARGLLIAVSPVFSVPLRGTLENDDVYSEGFLVELHACEKSKSANDQKLYSFEKPVFIYFHGNCSAWRPILSMLIGVVVAISGLKKKYISSGESQFLIFVSTQMTVLHELGKLVDENIYRIKFFGGKENRIGNYCGVVSGIFDNGMVVELDQRNVWLLLATHQLDLPHSLRVGALVLQLCPIPFNVRIHLLFSSPTVVSWFILDHREERHLNSSPIFMDASAPAREFHQNQHRNQVVFRCRQSASPELFGINVI